MAAYGVRERRSAAMSCGVGGSTPPPIPIAYVTTRDNNTRTFRICITSIRGGRKKERKRKKEKERERKRKKEKERERKRKKEKERERKRKKEKERERKRKKE